MALPVMSPAAVPFVLARGASAHPAPTKNIVGRLNDHFDDPNAPQTFRALTAAKPHSL